MIEKLIEQALKNRIAVVIAMILMIAAGIQTWTRLSTDAFPDASPVLVPIFAETGGLAPQEVERLVSFPIEQAMNGLPDVKLVKSTSAFGMAVVYVYFEDKTDIYFARQLVSERLGTVKNQLQQLEEEPTLGPIATGLGEVFMYYLDLKPEADTEGKPALSYLRDVNDRIVKPQIQTVKGVTEVLSMGGNLLQYQIKVDPRRMVEYGITFEEIESAVTASNRSAGGQYLERSGEEQLIRGTALLRTLEDIRTIPVKTVKSIPITVSDLAEVEYGPASRRGVVILDGDREIVAGMVMKLYGENTSDVIKRLNKKFASMNGSLPAGVTIVPYYNQQGLVDRAVATMGSSLWQSGVMIFLMLLLFLGDMRSSIIVALALPFCALTAILLMGLTGMSANLMSLGGIAVAIGLLADGAIVMVENIHRHLTSGDLHGKTRTEKIAEACREVARPILFALLIVIIVFVPIFMLEGVEGKMFKPMALTMIFAVAGSILASLFGAPVLSWFLLKPGESKGTVRFITFLQRIYRPILITVIKFKEITLAGAVILFVGMLFLATKLGTEFMPVLEEGSITVSVAMAPSISLDQASQTVSDLQKMIAVYPEVVTTVAKIGRPEAGSHPHPVNSALIQIDLKPKKEWRFKTKDDFIAWMNKDLSIYPGVQLSFTQPIQHLFADLISGSKSQLVIKLFGENLDSIKTTAEKIQKEIASVEGLVDLAVEQSSGQPQLTIDVDRTASARLGIDPAVVMSVIEEQIGGTVADQLSVETRSYPIQMRMGEQFRKDRKALEMIPVPLPGGGFVELADVATFTESLGPIMINREKGQRRWTIEGNIRGRDLGSVVQEIQSRVDEKIELPAGVFVEYGGQFENQQRAMKRFALIVPIALLAIMVLLWMAFRSLKTAALIFVAVPMSLIGGILGLWITGQYLSVPASIGFIALFGISIQDTMVLVSAMHHLKSSGSSGWDAVVEGAVSRLRPVLLTTFTTQIGLLPLLISTGAGAEVQRPLAAVVFFGLMTSTPLTLLVKPALYYWFERDDGEVAIEE